MHKKLLTGAAATTLLLGLAACDQNAEPDAEASGGAEEEGQEAPMGQEDMEMPEPDTEDIPDVVATVNGEELSSEEFIPLYEQQFQQMAMQAQMSGEEPDEATIQEQVLDTAIGTELLLQDAEQQGFEASEEDIDAALEDAAEQGGMESADELIEAYEEQGNSEEELREDASDQALINQVTESLDIEEPSEEELQELYDQQEQQQEMMAEAQGGEGGGEGAPGAEQQEMPPFDEVRDELEEQAAQQNENEALMSHIEELREDADVETHL
ncbi:SurA N-terminal domain-containing protein [Nesterenkonia lacusekhoensis]|uniref:Peptidyl-prolyl cis-trans isomerase SurA n=1 Tax=Nesterenkonia lacusekhoensis TaxID=150832 RepID=A0ABS4SYQ8_9MICC|nr:peptidyl-prolyl cis-trans isomerase SurA [Nesterenkonia lacusekhoensis]